MSRDIVDMSNVGLIMGHLTVVHQGLTKAEAARRYDVLVSLDP